ncbi:O-antigen ligase family protein [Citrobacter freundii]|uniref:O-antigen ligase family protein n=1 Tax=Citrobacter freundii TaxID=546 RepID=UPI002B3E3251|nr:O-antigen ligase family protein [Citrobacter freundii]
MNKTLCYFIIGLLLCLFIYKPPFDLTVLNALIIHFFAFVALFVIIKQGVYRNVFYCMCALIIPLLFLTVTSGIVAAYPMAVAVVAMLALSNSKYTRPIQQDDFFSILALLILICSFWSLYESHTGRYSLLNGDPNYTSLILLTINLLMLKIVKSKILKNIIYMTILFSVFITGSRTAVLALLAYCIASKIKSKFSFFLVLLFMSVTIQYVAAYILPNLLTYFNFGHIRYLNLDDPSNIERTMIYKDAVDFIFNRMDYFWINGTTDYFSMNPDATNIPHNWFVQSILGFGFTYTIIYTLVLILVVRKIHFVNYYLYPFICFFIMYSAFLSYYSLTTPLLFITTIMLILNERWKLK